MSPHVPTISSAPARSNVSKVWKRIRQVVVALALGAPVLLLLAAWFQPWFTPSDLTRDPLAVATGMWRNEIPCCSRYLGALSSVGIMMWSAAAAICVTTAIVLSLLGAARSRIVLFALAGVLSTWLWADDVFMLHERYSPTVFGGLGLFKLIPATLLLPLIAALMMTRARSGLGLLAGSVALLAGSVVIDDFVYQSTTAIFFEDALKLVGISLWTAFFMLQAIEFILEAAPQDLMGQTAPNRARAEAASRTFTLG